jgi:hypothetical protein
MPSATENEAASKVCLVLDDGLFVHVAEALAKGFKKVLYGLALRRTAPKSCDGFIGVGLPNVERVGDIFEAAQRADLVVFPDVYTADLASELQRQAKPVFGATNPVALLETDRWATRQLIRDVGLPVVKARKILGIDALEAALKESEDKWVKGLRYRGDFETFHHVDYFMSRPWLHDLKSKLGPTGANQVFVLEDSIGDAVEVGLDCAVVKGEFPDTVSYGYEDKGAGYLGRVVKWKDLPKPLKEVAEKFQPVLKERAYTGWFSMEVRVTKEGIPYFIDPACRCGLPPSESYVELFSNWPEFVLNGANGKLTDLKPTGKFSAQIQMTAEFAREHYLAWDIPESERRWVKLQNHFRQHGMDYNCPNGDTLVGAVTAVGNELEDVMTTVQKRAGSVKAYSLDYDEGALNRLTDAVKRGQTYGVTW